MEFLNPQDGHILTKRDEQLGQNSSFSDAGLWHFEHSTRKGLTWA